MSERSSLTKTQFPISDSPEKMIGIGEGVKRRRGDEVEFEIASGEMMK